MSGTARVRWPPPRRNEAGPAPCRRGPRGNGERQTLVGIVLFQSVPGDTFVGPHVGELLENLLFLVFVHRVEMAAQGIGPEPMYRESIFGVRIGRVRVPGDFLERPDVRVFVDEFVLLLSSIV